MRATVRVLTVMGLSALIVFLPETAAAKSNSCQFQLSIPKLHVFPLFEHVRGGKDMGGASPLIDLSAVIHRPETRGTQADNLRLDLNVQIAGDKGKGATFKGHQTFWLSDRWIRGGTTKDIRQCLDAMFEDCIKAFKKGAVSDKVLNLQCTNAARFEIEDSFRADAGAKGRNWNVYKTKTQALVSSAECIGDANGGDRGKIGCRNITFRPRIKINVNFGKKALAR